MNIAMASAEARAAAVQALIAAHVDEFEQLYGDERERRGLPRFVGRSASTERLLRMQQRIAELEAKLKATQT